MRHEPIEQWDRRRRGVGVRLDITNVRSGKLVGVKPVSRTQFATIVWPCQCDCGNTTHVVASLIARGITRRADARTTGAASAILRAGSKNEHAPSLGEIRRTQAENR